MPLRFFRQSRQPPSPPPHWRAAPQRGSRPMSPARAALAAHLEAIAGLNAQIAQLEQHHRASSLAATDLEEAEAAVQAITEREKNEWFEFVQRGSTGAKPSPHDGLRTQAQQLLAQARSVAQLARERCEAVQPLTDEAHAQLRALLATKPQLLSEATIEEAREIADRMCRSYAEASAFEAALQGLRVGFLARSDGVSAFAIGALLSGGAWPAPHEFRTRLNKRTDEIRLRWAKFLETIEADPVTRFDLEPPAPKRRAA
jgi:hypothetical protein